MPMAPDTCGLSNFSNTMPHCDSTLCAAISSPKKISNMSVSRSKSSDQNPNWLMGDVSAYLNSKNLSAGDSKLKPQGLAGLLKEVDSGKISGKMAKDIIIEMLDTGKGAAAIISEKGLSQISDTGELEKFAEETIAENAKTAEDFLKGKDNALMFLVGQVMKKTKGKANPAVVNKILRDKLSKK